MSSNPASTRAIAPRNVNTAYWLYVVSAVVGLIGFVLTLVLLPAAVTAVEQQYQGRDTGGVDVHAVAVASATGTAIVGGLFAVAFFVLTLVFAAKMRAGRNWARIVLAVFAALHVVGLLSLALGSTPVVSALLSVVVAVLAAIAAILTFLRESNAWFQEQKAARATTTV